MYKHKRHTVFLLSDCALMAFGNHLIKSLTIQTKIKPDKHISSKPIKKYMNSLNTTPEIRQRLLNLIAEADHSTVIPTVRNICFKILLDDSITYFGAYIYWDTYYKKVWKYMARQCTGLRTLNLTNTHLSEYQMDYFEVILKRNKKLTQFNTPLSSRKGKVLELVGKHCPQLKCIIFSEHDDLLPNADFLIKSCFANSLTRIDLKIPRILEVKTYAEALSTILQSCPNLESLTDAYVGLALVICHSRNKDFKCNLRKVCDSHTSKEFMEIIINTCPKLNQLRLRRPDNDALLALKKIDLRELIVEYITLPQFVEILKNVGSGLVSLTLKESSSVINLEDLVEYCPKLTKFVFESSSNMQIGDSCGIFENLLELRIKNSLISVPVIRKILCCTMYLQIFHMDQLDFDDADLLSVLTKNGLENLRAFHIKYAPCLTLQSVHMLLEFCRNLQEISSIQTWDINRLIVDNISYLRKVSGPDVQLKLPYLPEAFVLLKLYNYK